MIYIALLKTNELPTPKEEHRLGLSLFSALYEHIYKKEPPPIAVGEGGKPFLKEEGAPIFNISHSFGIIAAAISNEGNIGIDVQKEIEKEKAEHIISRFPYIKIRETQKIKGEHLSFFQASLKCDKISLSPTASLPTSLIGEPRFTQSFTQTEAILKAEGGGFRSAGKLDELESSAKTASFKFGDFFLSVALINQS